jgi:large subunit ribosomal protein L22
VRLSAEKLNRHAAAAGATVETLAPAMVRRGLTAREAPSAVRNWMSGKDHPRATPEDVRALAAALACEPKDLVSYRSIARYMRSGHRKAQLVATLIRGKPVDQAMNLLTFCDKRAADMATKALKAAIADAEHGQADVTRLVVSESRIDEGPTIKRFRPKDRGRAHPIMKRTSHFVIAVEESA